MGKTKLGALALLMIFVIYASFLYLRIWYFLQSYQFGYKIEGTDLRELATFSHLNDGTKTFDVKFSVWIQNLSDFTVTVRKLNVQLFYGTEYIGQARNFDEIIIQRKKRTDLNGVARMTLNRPLFYLMLAASEKPVRIRYKATFYLYGIPFPFHYNSFYDYSLKD